MGAISAGDLVLLRQPVNTQRSVERLYLFGCPTLWTGRVNEEPARGDRTITYDGGAMAAGFAFGDLTTFGAGLEVWFGSSAGAKDVGVRRLRSMGAGAAAGNLVIDWADDLDISDDDYITIKHFYPPWPKYSWFTASGPEFRKDGPDGTLYSASGDANETPAPHVIMGRNYANELPAVGSIAIQCDATNSVDVAGGGGGATYAWDITPPGGAALDDATSGTPVLTLTTTGKWWLHCTVTIDGRSSTGHRAVQIGGGITEFARGPITHNWDQSEIEVSLTLTSPDVSATGEIRPEVDWDDVQDHSLVIIAATDTYGATQKSITFRSDGVYTDRAHIVFSGYLMLENDDLEPLGTGQVELQAVSMTSLFLYSQSLTGVTNATQWYEMHQDLMTVAGNLLHLFRWHSTLLDIADWWLPWTDTVKRSANEEFGEGDIFERARALTRQRFMGLTCNPQGEIFVETDLNLRTSAERAAETVTMTLTAADIADVKRVRRRRRGDVARILLDGGYSSGVMGSYQPFFSASQNVAIAEARPALAHYDRVMLPTQAEANRLSGRLEAVTNRRVGEINLDFTGNYREVFSPADQQFVNTGQVFAAALKANIRGFSDLTSVKLIPRSVTHSHDNAGGVTTVSVIFEPQATTDVNGVTQPQPAPPSEDPWDGGWDFPAPPAWPPVPPSEAVPGAGWAADNALGVYFRYEDGRWEARNTGLPATTTRDLIWDPWQKAVSANPEDAKLYTCGVGFLAVSEDGGKNWVDLTPTLSDPPDPWADCGGVTASGLTYKQIHADIHANGTFYVLAEYQSPISLLWRAWLLSTEDHWMTHAWYALRPLTVAGGSGISSWTFDDDMEDWVEYRDYCVHEPLLVNNPLESTAWDGSTGSPAAGSIAATGNYDVAFYPSVIGAQVSGLNLTIEAGSSLAWKFRIVSKTVLGGGGTHYTTLEVCTTGGVISSSSNLLGQPAGGWQSMNEALGALAGETITALTWYQHCGADVEAQVNLDSVTLNDVTATDEGRPLACDLDNETGDQLYVTIWNGQGIQLWVLDVSDPALPAFVRAHGLGTASSAEVSAKTYFAVPRCGYLPGVASFGDYVYVFGRMAGSVGHVGRSTDAGVTFSDISPAGLTTQRIGALHADSDDLTLFCIVNNDGAGTSALYRSTNTGAAWTSMVASTFCSEHDAFSKHPSGTILVAANAAITSPAARALTSASPYAAVVDVSGVAPDDLPFDVDGSGGFNSIVWYA